MNKNLLDICSDVRHEVAKISCSSNEGTSNRLINPCCAIGWISAVLKAIDQAKAHKVRFHYDLTAA